MVTRTTAWGWVVAAAAWEAPTAAAQKTQLSSHRRRFRDRLPAPTMITIPPSGNDDN
jgi:hypothetical protein